MCCYLVRFYLFYFFSRGIRSKLHKLDYYQRKNETTLTKTEKKTKKKLVHKNEYETIFDSSAEESKSASRKQKKILRSHDVHLIKIQTDVKSTFKKPFQQRYNSVR